MHSHNCLESQTPSGRFEFTQEIEGLDSPVIVQNRRLSSADSLTDLATLARARMMSPASSTGHDMTFQCNLCDVIRVASPVEVATWTVTDSDFHHDSESDPKFIVCAVSP